MSLSTGMTLGLSVSESYKMNTSFTKKTVKKIGFNPFREVCKVIRFAEEAGRAGHDRFTVLVRDGQLTYDLGQLHGKTAGFIAVIDRVKFAAGVSTKAWRVLEEKIAKEIYSQRKAW